MRQNAKMRTAWLCVYCETEKLTECVSVTVVSFIRLFSWHASFSYIFTWKTLCLQNFDSAPRYASVTQFLCGDCHLLPCCFFLLVNILCTFDTVRFPYKCEALSSSIFINIYCMSMLLSFFSALLIHAKRPPLTRVVKSNHTFLQNHKSVKSVTFNNRIFHWSIMFI